MGQKKKNQGTG